MGRVGKEFNDFCMIEGDPNIGENVWVGYFTLLDASGGLTIEENVSISSGVQIVSHSTHLCRIKNTKFVDGKKSDKDVLKAPVTIEKHSFIGSNAVILMGVTVGHHSIVGAGAVVNKDIPPYSIAVGVPAKVVGSTKKFLEE